MNQKNTDWNFENIKKLLENMAITKGYALCAVTEKIDHVLPPTDLSAWMDTIGTHSGGWYHRVKHGHDFLANVSDVQDKFGWDGVFQYPFEIARDATTAHGVPAPGTEFLVNAKVVGAKQATEWLSVSVADVFTGGLAAYSTYRLYKKTKNGRLDKKTVIWATIGVVVKIASGTVTTNPILILSGLADAAILLTSFEDTRNAFKQFLGYLITKKAFASYSGAAVGAGAAAGATAAATAFGVASTGTAISTLSGAAATNAMLAAFGGGSLAAGGFGIAGGIAVLSGGTLLIGAAAAYGAYRLMKFA